MTLYDKTGRKMEDGDLFRVLHFIDRRRRKRYQYFLLQYTPQFDTKWWGVDIRGGFAKHHWPVYEDDGWNLEIVHSLPVKNPEGEYDDFVDRPINREVLEQREKEDARNDSRRINTRMRCLPDLLQQHAHYWRVHRRGYWLCPMQSRLLRVLWVLSAGLIHRESVHR